MLISRLSAQESALRGKVVNEKGLGIAAELYLQEKRLKTRTNSEGEFRFEDLSPGEYTLIIYAPGLKSQAQKITHPLRSETLQIVMKEFQSTLSTLTVEADADQGLGQAFLNSVDDFGIYEAKKSEVIFLKNRASNQATNNARQIFAQVAGLNIWESDAAGLQLDIAARGLNPNRSSSFNTRLNGYDMSADALGYPESYYAPPTQAVEKIEIVRGAASLQYGPQFGGMVNFVLKEAPEDQKIQWESEQTLGSYGFFNSYNSLSGTLGKWSYYTYYQYKKSEGWRENTDFDLHSAFARVDYQANDRLQLRLEYSFMDYLAHQAGGLTDANFAQDAQQSLRDRNWFKVNWNLLAFILEYKLSEKTKLNVRNFALFSGREALGNLEQINRIDLGGNRSLIRDRYRNFGSETRLLHRYSMGAQNNALILGFRYYQGLTLKQQGDGNDDTGPDFEFLNAEDLENSDYDFPSRNYAFFAENIFNLSPRWSLTPGLRVEHIRTFSDGFYKQTVRDQAGNVVIQNRIEESTGETRTFALLGLGISRKFGDQSELYANASQNYRSITFSDLRIDNPNFLLDSLIQDEKGYNLDIGYRGNIPQRLQWDLSLFYLRYNDRIGFVLLENQPPLFLDYRFRTNVGDSRHYGLEGLVEFKFDDLILGKSSSLDLSTFLNFSWIQAQYVNSENTAIIGKKVEYVPEFMLRGGLNVGWKNLQVSLQASWVGEQFTDASNALRTANAVSGIIPAYFVADFSCKYQFKFLYLHLDINNLSDERYFTRRASSYPGPGIIPANARSIYLGIGLRL